MSLYALDKALREVIHTASAREAYAADPQAFLAGRDLTATEHDALARRDFTELYRLGGHPFLLVGFVATQYPPAERGAGMAAYQKSLARLGYPDYST